MVPSVNSFGPVTIFYGEMGAGKSYQAKRYAEANGLTFFEGDSVLPRDVFDEYENPRPLITPEVLEKYVHTILFSHIVNYSSYNPKGVVVAQALYRRSNRERLRNQLESLGIEVTFVHVKVGLWQNLRQLWSRRDGFLWVLYWLQNKPFFQP